VPTSSWSAMTVPAIVFWGSLGIILYAYLGYPLMLTAISIFRERRVAKADISPPVSFIITAYNEEKRIRQKIENTLTLDYRKELLEIIVASDCSTDDTDAIVRSYQPQGVKLVRAPQRKGKEHAQGRALKIAAGDIIIFSDVATILRSDGITNIVKNFNDGTIGCVSSVDKFIDQEGTISGEGAYVRYEMLLRGLESKINSLVGLSGSFFAARKSVCMDWADDLPSDFNTLMNSVKMGLRGVQDQEATGFYANIADEKREFHRKVRTVLRGISVLMKNLNMLNFIKYGLFSWQLFSHKLCRWIVPFALTTGLLSNAALIHRSSVYAILFAAQCLFYASAAVGIRTCLFAKQNAVKVPSFFVLVNLSIMNAWFRYLRGERMPTWDPSRR
jgi:cellulose synthase/poly-beta-1,6-N-acetylglucosamine synthase-like glycosyltransferase